MKDCSVDDCTRPSRSKGLCAPHYQKLVRHGTPTPDPSQFKKRGPKPNPEAWRSRHNPDNPSRSRPKKPMVERTHCVNGHPLGEGNTYWHSTSQSVVCKTCAKAATRRYRLKVDPNKGKPRTHCRNGHEISPENTVTYGDQDRCLPCVKQAGGRQRLKKYRLSSEEYEAMLSSQSGRCAICEDLMGGGKNEHIDHDHVTGQVRGILCSQCNTAIGKFKDSPEIILKAAEYVMRSWDQTSA